MKRIWIITLFPEYFEPLVHCGIAGQLFRGERGEPIEIKTVQLRHHTLNDYKGVDDSPFGGGAGMVMRADVLKKALMEGVAPFYGHELSREELKEKVQVIYMNPRGVVWSHRQAKHLAKSDKDLVFLCGRYEGIDERFIERYVDLEYSIGDYILTGGEIAAMAIIDSTIRFLSGALKNAQSLETESFEGNLLEHPQYTRPKEFEGISVPEVLLSGHHLKIKEYRLQEQLRITAKHRPDLLSKD